MKVGNLLFSAVQFIFALLVILLGVFFVGLDYAPHLRLLIAHFLASGAAHFSLIGYLILGCGLTLLFGFVAMYRGVYYRVRMKSGDLCIDPALIRSYLNDYWKEKFPEEHLSVEVSVSRNQKLSLLVELPLLSVENHQAILERAEEDLGALFRKCIGYTREFEISVLIK